MALHSTFLPERPALILADGLFRTPFAKTAHGLVRGPSRFPIAAIVDSDCTGEDAGQLLDGTPRGIPCYASVPEALEALDERPAWAVVGVATVGGLLPPALRRGLLDAASAGLSLVNGLHRHLADDHDLAQLVDANGGRIVDFRRPRPAAELHSWTGEVLHLETPRIAVLGTDCAVGKRTTATRLTQTLSTLGVAAEMIYTGQTGWLQGFRHGFLFDATPNDFVCGELEWAILECNRETNPDLILLEGQSSLRNPSGPAGAEFILSGAISGVVLQHAPARRFFEDLEHTGIQIPPVAQEVELIRLLGAEVWAVTLNEEGLDDPEGTRARLAAELGLPVLRPLEEEGIAELAELVQHRAGLGTEGNG